MLLPESVRTCTPAFVDSATAYCTTPGFSCGSKPCRNTPAPAINSTPAAPIAHCGFQPRTRVAGKSPTHSPAARPTRIFAFISAAIRFQSSSGEFTSDGTCSRRAVRSSPNDATVSRQSPHRRRCLFRKKRFSGPHSPPASKASSASEGCRFIARLPLSGLPHTSES